MYQRTSTIREADVDIGARTHNTITCSHDLSHTYTHTHSHARTHTYMRTHTITHKHTLSYRYSQTTHMLWTE